MIDKSRWGDGPWQREPDRVRWTDPETGLECLMNRHATHGSWCGYVGVGPEHPAYELSYDGNVASEFEEYLDESRAEMRSGKALARLKAGDGPATKRPEVVPGIGERVQDIEVHGGLTYAAQWEGEGDLWWFGFDCCHAFDLVPGLEAIKRELPRLPFPKVAIPPEYRDVYRDESYVRGEVESLARQLARLVVKIEVPAEGRQS